MTNKEAHLATIKLLLFWLTLITIFLFCLWAALEVTMAIVVFVIVGGTLYSIYETVYSTLKGG